MSLLSTPLSELNLDGTYLDAESDSDTSPQVRTHSDRINEVLALLRCACRGLGPFDLIIENAVC